MKVVSQRSETPTSGPNLNSARIPAPSLPSVGDQELIRCDIYGPLKEHFSHIRAQFFRDVPDHHTDPRALLALFGALNARDF